MQKLTTAVRVLLGAAFTVFGLNGFLHFLPNPPLPPAAGAFIGALVQSGYLMTVVKATEVFAGVLVLTGIAVPFALVLLAPIVLNINLFHFFLAPEGLPMAIAVGACELLLAWQHRRAFTRLFSA